MTGHISRKDAFERVPCTALRKTARAPGRDISLESVIERERERR
jgi:hypothetical protein